MNINPEPSTVLLHAHSQNSSNSLEMNKRQKNIFFSKKTQKAMEQDTTEKLQKRGSRRLKERLFKV